MVAFVKSRKRICREIRLVQVRLNYDYLISGINLMLKERM